MAAFFDTLHRKIAAIEPKKFLYYVGIILGITIALIGGLIFQYYRSIHAITKRIGRINQYRQQAQDILERAQEVITQRQQVDSLLAEDLNFKIGGYFKDVLNKLQLSQKEKMETTQTIEREDNYLEQVLNAKFVDLNMKELTTLLAEIEGNPRIYTRELEIKRGEKTPGTIDVTLVIATLLPIAKA
ncbi:MAG TPA: hypothetical protein VGW78_04235 [Candidatus Babeliales bacterium]|jgi:hypothetical protein|nr:hypothetical protein [Candidatus Babeliales bacterium]